MIRHGMSLLEASPTRQPNQAGHCMYPLLVYFPILGCCRLPCTKYILGLLADPIILSVFYTQILHMSLVILICPVFSFQKYFPR